MTAIAVGGLALSGMCVLAPRAVAAEPIEVRIGDSSIMEGNPGEAAALTFALRLSAPVALDTYIYLHTVDSGATHRSRTNRGGDFGEKRLGVAKVKIRAGKTVGSVAVAEHPDSAMEGDEVFDVVIDKVTTTIGGDPDPAYTVVKSTGAGTIVDDDFDWLPLTSPTISIGSVVVPEGNPTQIGVARLNVRLSQPMATDEYVYFHTEDNGGTAGADYRAKAGKVKVAAGKTSAFIATRVVPDSLAEDWWEDSYTVVIDKVTPTIGGEQDPLVGMLRRTGWVSIIDDDPITVPSPPASVTAAPQASAGLFDLTWSAPINDGGGSLTNWLVEVSTDSGRTWSFVLWAAGPGTKTVSCNGGMTCRYRVSVQNEAGRSAPMESNDVSVPTDALPGAPQNFTAHLNSLLGSPYFDVAWNPPATGAAPTDYVIYWSNDGGVTYHNDYVSPMASSPDYQALYAGHYLLRLHARNSAGLGPASNVVELDIT